MYIQLRERLCDQREKIVVSFVSLVVVDLSRLINAGLYYCGLCRSETDLLFSFITAFIGSVDINVVSRIFSYCI